MTDNQRGLKIVMGKMLTVRQRQILGILNSQKERISGREIAEYLGVTDRTVRTDIQILTTVLRSLGVEIDAIRGKGYLLKNHDSALMQSLVYQEGGVLTPEDRIRVETIILLESADPVDIDDLAEECYASRSTIEHDLKVISYEFGKGQPHIRLKRHRNSVEMEKDEWKRRYCMNLLYMRRWNFNYEAGILMSDLPVSGEEITLIDEALTSAQTAFRISLSEHDHVSFLFSLAIALRRIRMGYFIGTASAGGTENTRKAVAAILDAIGKHTGVKFSCAESSTLSDELAYRQQYRDDGFPSEEELAEYTEDSPLALLINRVLRLTDEEYNTAHSDNIRLKWELLHILRAQTLNPFHTGLRDEYVTRRIRAEYPDALELACRFETALREFGKEGLSENYLFELVAALAEAVEEDAAGKRGEGIPVMIISHMTYGATRVLMTQIRTFFGSRVRLLGPIPVYEALRNGCGGAALAVTTTKMRPADESLPYLTIPRMMDRQNLDRMNFLISLENYRLLYPGKGRWITEELSVFRVINGLPVRGHRETLKALTRYLITEGLADEGFASEVEARERQTSTSFREGFALPHAINAGAKKSGLVLLKPDKTIDWGGIPVDLVILFFLGKDQLKSQMRIYCCIVYLLRKLKSQKRLQELTEDAEFKELLEYTERHG